MIQVSDFHKAYRQTVAVEGLSFDVQAGQVLGLLGPNGAGKTTTLRAIAGVIPPTRGNLRVGGHDVTATRWRPSGCWLMCRTIRSCSIP